MIDISKIGKAEALRRLYNKSKPQGMGFMHYTPADMTKEQAEAMIQRAGAWLYFDYVQGRVMKVDLSKDEFDPRLYDRDNGPGAAARAIEGT